MEVRGGGYEVWPVGAGAAQWSSALDCRQAKRLSIIRVDLQHSIEIEDSTVPA